MDLYIGGFAQGKLGIVEEALTLEGREYEVLEALDVLGKPEGAITPEGKAGNPKVWILNHLHLAVKSMVDQMEQTDVCGPACDRLAAEMEKAVEELAAWGDLVLICDEVGNGIVPMDSRERAYRETVGRVLIHLASRADRVERIISGLRQRLK